MKTKSARTRRAKTNAPNSEPVPIVIPVINGERPVTSAQIADHFQITTRTLADWRAKRKIPYWRINSRNFRYRVSDVEKALMK